MSDFANVPAVTLRSGGIALPSELSGCLARVRVRQRLAAPSLCELVFDEPPALRAAGGLDVGADLEVEVEAQTGALFSGVVVALEHTYTASGGRQLRVRAYDHLQLLRRSERVQGLRQLTLADYAREAAGEIGLTVDAKADSPRIEAKINDGENGLDFLDRLARAFGIYYFQRHTRLELLGPEGRGGDAVELELGKSLFDLRIEHNAQPQKSAVTVSAWNASNVESFTETERPTRAGGGSTGPDPVDAPATITNVRADSTDEASALARGRLQVAAASGRIASGTAEGDVRLLPGAPATLSGADGGPTDIVIARAEHRIDPESGYVTTFSTELPAPIPRGGPQVTFGIVEQVDDPAKRGRVCVRLPTVGDEKTPWLPCVFPGGGPTHGLICVPNVGDRVLVLCPHGDPADGVILGGVYGAEPPWDTGTEDNRVARFAWKTDGDQGIELDDDERRITISSATGTRARFADDVHQHSNADFELQSGGELRMSSRRATTLSSGADLVLEAPGATLTIRAAKIDFVKG